MRVVFALVVTLAPQGCRTTSPIHHWQPPEIASLTGETLVLTDIAGPEDTAAGIREKLIAETGGRNRDSAIAVHRNPPITLLMPEQLETESIIRLVSGSESEPSDLAIASVARRAGVNYLLHGEILHATGTPHSDERLSVVWRLVGIGNDATNEGMPITIDQKSIEQNHPDLLQVSDPHSRLQQAMARETMGLFRRSVVRQPVTLAHPRLTLGSGEVRRGNRLAQRGDWRAAEEIWLHTLDRNPGQVSAWINAAIAAGARQDFEQASQRITRAIQLSLFFPVHHTLAQETLVWLELRQREYHESFGLPDPPDGWRVTHQVPSMNSHH